MLWFALITALFARPESCTASVFGYPGDRLAGGDALHLKRPVGPDDVGIAHRRHRLGSRVLVVNQRTGLAVVATVIDRGPYGKLDDSGQWFNGARERDRPGRYRGCADLTPRAAEWIDHNGLERVRVYLLASPGRSRS
jgi:hypothetical protein